MQNPANLSPRCSEHSRRILVEHVFRGEAIQIAIVGKEPACHAPATLLVTKYCDNVLQLGQRGATAAI